MTRSILAGWTRVAGAAIAASLALAACSDRPAPSEQAVPQAAASVVPAGFREATLRRPETNLHYVWGGRGPAVILLHGFPEDWSAWRKVAPLLADRFTVIAPDLRGIGGSTTTSAAFDPASMADDIAALMSARGISEAYIVGHDLGGASAYALARLHPERVRGLMLLESPLEGMPSWMKLKTLPVMWHFGFHQTQGIPEQLIGGREAIYVRHFLKESTGGKQPDEADVARYAQAYGSPESLAAALAIYRQLPRQEEFNLKHRQSTAMPVTVVGGEQALGPVAAGMANDLKAWGWSNAESVVVPAAGHYVADEQPNALAALIATRAALNVSSVAAE